jgi:TRAP transporter TAXI family solute receptor
MSQRLAALIALAGFLVLAAIAAVTLGNKGLADAPPSRIAFQIATGSSEGTYFPIGQAVAGLVSHPPGIGRCEIATVCGPAGVILSARTSQGAVENLKSVNQGLVDSGFAQGDVIADAVAGRGPFRKGGKLTHLRVIAALFPEQVHLIAAPKAGIEHVADLRGKRVMLGSDGSGTAVTAREILSAYRLPTWRIRLVAASAGNPAQLLQAGKLDAYFMVAGAPLEQARELIRHGHAKLVPIDGAPRNLLVRSTHGLMAVVIPAGVYPGAGAVETVAMRAFWVTRDSAADGLIYGVTRALFNPANRPALAASHPAARAISLARAGVDLPAPLHPGAARFYREAGALPR